MYVDKYMDKRKEPVKPYREAILEGPSNPILDKAMDYMINPYPKVSDSVLEITEIKLSSTLSSASWPMFSLILPMIPFT